MGAMPRKLCELYMQDFDLVFQQETDPIDLFCQQHDVSDQKKLLAQMKSFYEGILSGKNSLNDLREMGLEYVPSDDLDPAVWLPPLIEHLEGKITAL